MGIGKYILCGLLLIALHTHQSSSQSVSNKRDEDRGNLHPGRVILYRPVASNNQDRSFLNNRDGERPTTDNSRRFTWDRVRTNFPDDSRLYNRGNKHISHPEHSRPYNRDKERSNQPEHNRPYNREKERNIHPEHNRPYNSGKEGNNPEYIQPYNRNKDHDNHPEQNRHDKDYQIPRPGFLRDRTENFRPQRFEDRKLPASKYANDYFQPPRPTPKNRIQNRNSFLFPGENDSGRGSFWAPRGVTPYNNVVDYLPRERHRFHSNLATNGYDSENLGFKHRPRPGLLQGNIATGIPIPGSGIIVASGPGGVRHVIHDLRVPVHTHIHHNGEKIPHTGNEGDLPFRVVGHQFSGGENNPYSNINQAYKGVPIFIQGGTVGGKEYDPRFIALYRQVLEENQKKIIPQNKEKGQGSFRQTDNFQSSPSYEWFSEPDPLYHPRNSALLTLPHLQLTTGLAFESELQSTTGAGFGSQEHSTTGTVQLSSGTGTDFLTELHSTTGTAYEAQLPTSRPFTEEPGDSSDSTIEQLLPPAAAEPTAPPKVSSSTSEIQPTSLTETPALKNTDSTTKNTPMEEFITEPIQQQTISQEPAGLDDDIYRLSSPFIQKEKLSISATDKMVSDNEQQTLSAQPPHVAPDPVDEVISTSISHSVSAIRLTRERVVSNATEILETSHLTQRQQLTDNSTPQSLATGFTEPEQDRVTSVTYETSTVPEINEITTEISPHSSHDTQLVPSNDNIKLKSDLKEIETTTIYNEQETTTVEPELQTETTDSTTTVDPTTLNDSQTLPTTTATELALTTLNYLVISLVNQVRANTILSESFTTPLPTSEET